MSARSLSTLLTTGFAATHPVAGIDGRYRDWGSFTALVRRYRTRLEAIPGQRWLLYFYDPFAFAAALLALWQLDRVPVLPPNNQPGTVGELCGQVDGQVGDLPPNPELPGIPADTDDQSDSLTADCRFRVLPVTSTLELFTSGSTGKPKRIVKTLAQLDAEIAALEQLWGRDLGNARVQATVSHQHIYGLLFRLLWPLCAGRKFDCRQIRHPGALVESLAGGTPPVLVSSPAFLARLPDMALPALPALPRRIFSSGGPLPASAAEACEQWLGSLPVEVLGSSETGGVAWRRQATEQEDWHLLPGVQLTINDTDQAVQVSSPFTGGSEYLALGDRGEWTGPDRFRLLGRVDTLVKIEEKRISLTAMTERLRALPTVADGALVVLHGRRTCLGAAVVLDDAGQRQLAEQGGVRFSRRLRLSLAPWFEPVVLPRKWRFVPSLPTDSQGKTTAAALTALFSEAQS